MIVADTNLVAYLLIKGEFTAHAERVFERDCRWIAPPLWWHELLNVVATTVREGKLDSDRAKIIIAEARNYVRPAEHDRPWQVLEMAVENRIATYDCEFVMLARQLLLPLVTADRTLLRLFPDVAVSITNFVYGK